MAWVFYTGFVGGFLIGFLVAWVGKMKSTQYTVIAADSVVRGQLDQEIRRANIAEERVRLARKALDDFPKA